MGKPLEVVISTTCGSVASSGNSSEALFWISRRRSAMRLSNSRSDNSLKRTRIEDRFSRLDEDTYLMSFTCAMASSSGEVSSCSTSSADAPGRTVMIFTQLKLISGSCARGINT